MKVYLITGISGFVGSMIASAIAPKKNRDADTHSAKAFNHLTDKENEKTDIYTVISDNSDNTSGTTEGEVRIIGICRNLKKAEERLGKYSDLSKIKLLSCDLTSEASKTVICNELKTLPESADIYMIHCASVTSSKSMADDPVSVSDGIIFGTKMLLDIAVQYNAASFVYISSMEVYGIVEDIGRGRYEYELGYIDIAANRSCYPLAKRMAEHYCHIYHNQYGLPVKIARLAQTFGIGTDPNDTRVFMQFAKAALEKRDIILKTDGLSVGNYVAIDDAIKAILTILYIGKNGECYNVVNEANTMTILEMAELVAHEIAGGEIAVKIEKEDIAKMGYAPKTSLKMSSEKVMELGWKPSKGLKGMYMDVCNSIKY